MYFFNNQSRNNHFLYCYLLVYLVIRNLRLKIFLSGLKIIKYINDKFSYKIYVSYSKITFTNMNKKLEIKKIERF